MSNIFKKVPRIALFIGLGLVIGSLITSLVRFVVYKPNLVHYHANFAIYINGQRDEFKGPGFYEEVLACATDNPNDVHDRAHMHGEINDVVHIHDHAVTWGQFFTNLGYTLGDTVLETENGTYVSGSGGQLKFILNGQPVENVANKVIGDRDILLVDYGHNDDATTLKHYNS